MARIMTVLNEGGLLKPGSDVYNMVRKMVTEKIDRLGPEAALAQVMARKAQLLDQIRMLAMWHRSTRRQKPPDYG